MNTRAGRWHCVSTGHEKAVSELWGQLLQRDWGKPRQHIHAQLHASPSHSSSLSPVFCFPCSKFCLTLGNLRATYTFWGRRYITGKHINMNNNCEKYFLFSWSVFLRFITWSELLFRILRYKELSLDNTIFFWFPHPMSYHFLINFCKVFSTPENQIHGTDIHEDESYRHTSYQIINMPACVGCCLCGV